MKNNKYPKLRTVNKIKPPYALNKFPKEFPYKLGREIVYLLATKDIPALEGSLWEKIFANCISAKWKPSNIGLDDISLGSCAWGAKTVKAKYPGKQKKVRLISGRNSPVYSFGESRITKVDPNHLGEQILSIWNERVSAVRKHYKHLRTIVLIKSDSLEELAVFEFNTIRYDEELYFCEWNKNKNLEGHSKQSLEHCFTWQPHGSQFTIIEIVPTDCLLMRIKKPKKIDKNTILKSIGFDRTWIKVINRNG